MKKIAIFVEGYTELSFVTKLLQCIAGAKNIHFHLEAWHGKKFIALSSPATALVEPYFALVVDCRSDYGVKSAILDRRAALIKAGYSKILGLRDVFPFTRGDIPKLVAGLTYGLPTAGIPIEIILAVMEVEAWFVQDTSHYIKIDPALTQQLISAKCGFNPAYDCAEDLPHPADFLDTVYKLAGKRYTKSKDRIDRTLNSLDYDDLYLSLRNRLPQFDKFVSQLDCFLS